jgi:hypothetical protein
MRVPDLVGGQCHGGTSEKNGDRRGRSLCLPDADCCLGLAHLRQTPSAHLPLAHDLLSHVKRFCHNHPNGVSGRVGASVLDSECCWYDNLVRREERRELSLHIAIDHGASASSASLTNVSSEGICFRAETHLPIGADLTVSVPGYGRIAVQVRWSIGSATGCRVYLGESIRPRLIMSKLLARAEQA